MLDAWLDLVHGGACAVCGRPGRVLCRPCATSLPRRCLPVRPVPCPDGLVACFAAGEYAGPLGALVVTHKERSAFALARPLGVVLAAVAEPVLSRGAPTFLVPVPSRASVIRSRGHDPMLRIARAASVRLRQAGHEVGVVGLLEQRFDVPDQAGLDSAARAANLAGSLRLRPAARQLLARAATEVSVVLCDDVLTTGATAREAQRAIEDAGLRTRAVVTVAATRRRLPPGGPRPEGSSALSRC